VTRLLPRATKGPLLAPPQPQPTSARDILDERRARGEIDLATYRELRKAMGEPSGPRAGAEASR